MGVAATTSVVATTTLATSSAKATTVLMTKAKIAMTAALLVVGASAGYVAVRPSPTVLLTPPVAVHIAAPVVAHSSASVAQSAVALVPEAREAPSVNVGPGHAVPALRDVTPAVSVSVLNAVPVPVPVVLASRNAAPVVAPRNAAPVVAPTSPVASTLRTASTLREEASLLDAARSSLAAHDPASAEQALALARSRFPDGLLTEERDALEIRVALANGDRTLAASRAALFTERYPASPMRSSFVSLTKKE
jgi:hypothetical protein